MRSFPTPRAVAFLAMVLSVLAAASAAAAGARPSNAEIIFRLGTPCPATGLTQGACNGYVVDRVIPIVCGGAEDGANMQWQTLAQAKEKARWEKIGCRKGRKLVLPTESKSVTESFAIGELPGGVQAQSLPVGRTAPPPELQQGSAGAASEAPETEPEPEATPP